MFQFEIIFDILNIKWHNISTTSCFRKGPSERINWNNHCDFENWNPWRIEKPRRFMWWSWQVIWSALVDHITSIFKRLSSTNSTWSIFEYLDPYDGHTGPLTIFLCSKLFYFIFNFELVSSLWDSAVSSKLATH